jgi:hypothetical protein
MAIRIINQSEGILTLPLIYGGTDLAPGQGIVLNDTEANIRAAIGKVPDSFLGFTVVTDPSAISPIEASVLLGRQVLSAASGTYVPTAGAKRVMLRLQGAGGGGGGVANTAAAQTATGGGGAAGDYVEAFIDPAGAVVGGAFVRGAGGLAGVNTGGAGGTGADSTIVINGTTYTAKGGTGGSFTGSSAAAQIVAGGAAQGGSTAGDLLVPAEPGVPGFTQSGTLGESGQGGNSPFGSGGAPKIGQGAGNVGTGFGSGGSGGLSINAAGAVTGGAGSNGLIIIYEYS